MEDLKKRTWAEVSLGAIESNYRNMRAALPAGCRFLGVVKADAYGHGAVPVATMLQEKGCDYLAVACLDEARILRKAGIRLPILILGFTPADYAVELAELSITQAVGSLSYARALSHTLAGSGKTLTVHLKLETGMGRTGFRTFGNAAVDDAIAAVRLPGLQAEGIFTHFCVSDEVPGKREFTLEQFARFRASYEAVEAAWGQRFVIHHCTNSGAMISFPETYMDMVRPGVSLYGMYPGVDRGSIALTPAMELYSRIAYIETHEPGDTISYGRTFTVQRPSRIAVLPIGYADGLHRALSNKLRVSVGGAVVSQVGRICMDMCMLDVTDYPEIQAGDVAQIFGRAMPIDTVAEQAGTIHYELTCAVAPRVPRIYL